MRYAHNLVLVLASVAGTCYRWAFSYRISSGVDTGKHATHCRRLEYKLEAYEASKVNQQA